MYCISRRTFWTLVCIHVLYIPGTYMHNRAHWYISILMQYFISQLQQHCVVKGCDPSRSVCLGRRIPAKLVKVRIDYCSALSYLIFRFLPRLVSPLGPGWTKFTDDEDCCGNKMKCLPWNTGVKPDRSRSPILPEAQVIVPINSCWLHWGGWSRWLANRQRAESELKNSWPWNNWYKKYHDPVDGFMEGWEESLWQSLYDCPVIHFLIRGISACIYWSFSVTLGHACA